MESKTNKTKRIEDRDFMQKTLSQIKDEADKVVSDRKKDSLMMELILEEYSIKIEIVRESIRNDKQDNMSEEEKEVVNRLAKGQKQVQIAKELGISQAKVSGIKSTHSSQLYELLSEIAKDPPKRFIGTFTKKKK